MKRLTAQPSSGPGPQLSQVVDYDFLKSDEGVNKLGKCFDQ